MLTVLCVSMFGLWSCNQDLRFSNSPEASKPIPVVKDPDVITPPISKNTYLKAQGACAANSLTQVTSCLKCAIPAAPPQAPQLSYKAQALLEIMTKACQVTNKSDPADYIAPDRPSLLARINRCSPTLYKDTNATADQNLLIQSLVADSDVLRKKMFGKLWYNPPYSDNFETFFGLDIGEVRGLLCYQNSGLAGVLLDAGSYHSPDPLNYKLPKEYVEANLIRDDLKNCLRESYLRPWVKQPDPPPRVCRFESISGLAGEPIQDQIQKWLSEGWTVGLESQDTQLDPDELPGPKHCSNIRTGEESKGFQGILKAAAYICD